MEQNPSNRKEVFPASKIGFTKSAIPNERAIILMADENVLIIMKTFWKYASGLLSGVSQKHSDLYWRLPKFSRWATLAGMCPTMNSHPNIQKFSAIHSQFFHKAMEVICKYSTVGTRK